MSFRRRMVLLAAGAVAAAVVLASVVVYVVTRNELRGQIDASLRQKLTPGQPQSVQVRASGQLRRTVNRRPTHAGKILHAEIVSIQGQGKGTVARGIASATGPDPAISPGDLAKLVLPTQKLGGATGYVQLIQSNGHVLRSESKGLVLPVTAAARAVAAGRRPAFFATQPSPARAYACSPSARRRAACGRSRCR